MQIVFSPPSKTLSLFRNQDVFFSANIEWSSCQDGAQYSFMWTPISQFPSAVNFSMMTSPIFFVPAFTLQADTTYSVQLTLIHPTNTNDTVKLSYDFDIQMLPLEAIITGGTETQVSVFNELTIDASPSFDPNEPEKAAAATQFNYTWTCVVYDPQLEQNVPCLKADGTPLILPNTPQLTIAPESLLASSAQPYNFTVEVSNAGKLVSSATKLVNVSPNPIPSVSVQPHDSMQRKQGQVYINADNNAIFRGSCVPTVFSNKTSTAFFKWTLGNQAGHSVDTSNLNVFSLGNDNTNFVILGNAGLVLASGTVSESLCFKCMMDAIITFLLIISGKRLPS
jgi:hypothetical protein